MGYRLKGERQNRFGSSKWKPEMAEQVFRYALLGVTQKQLAEFLGIGPSMLSYWMVNNEEFKDAFNRGKMEADANVAESWYKRAIGYDYVETKTTINRKGEMIVETTTKHIPGDPSCMHKWMAIRQRDNGWVEVSKSEHNINYTANINLQYVQEQLKDKKVYSTEELQQALQLSLKQITENAGSN